MPKRIIRQEKEILRDYYENNLVLRKALYAISFVAPAGVYRGIANRKMVFPYYHAVSDEEIPHLKHLYLHRSIQQFEEDLDYLLKNYSPISLQELLASQRSQHPLPRKAFMVSFDDGFREVYDVAAPILKKKGVVATVFLNTAFLDNKEMFFHNKISVLIENDKKLGKAALRKKVEDIFARHNMAFSDLRSTLLSIPYQKRDMVEEIAHACEVDFDAYLLKNKPYMSAAQVEALVRDGFSVGSHSIDHPPYQSLSLSEQLRQTTDSLKALKETFSLDYSAFSFPGSDLEITKAFFERLSKSGDVDVFFGTVGFRHDPFPQSFQRICMESATKPAEVIFTNAFKLQTFRLMTRRGTIKRR